jgi:hypothetical protein
MSDSRWYFTEEQLQSSPSRECGVSADRELAYRQQAANLIQEVGQRLQVYVLIPFCVEARENREIRGPRNASKCPIQFAFAGISCESGGFQSIWWC